MSLCAIFMQSKGFEVRNGFTFLGKSTTSLKNFEDKPQERQRQEALGGWISSASLISLASSGQHATIG